MKGWIVGKKNFKLNKCIKKLYILYLFEKWCFIIGGKNKEENLFMVFWIWI